MTIAYPLQWPEGWPRTPKGARSSGYAFKQETYKTSGDHTYKARVPVTFAKARERLYAELERLKASSVVVSTNHPADVRGVPVESKRRVEDDGVAVYFQYQGRQMVMACDRYDSTAANMRSLGLAIEALRQLERHGGGHMMERAFSGFSALPDHSGAPRARHWSEVLGVDPRPMANLSVGIKRAMIEAAYKDAIALAHPDRDGGSVEAAQEVNAAREQALSEIGT